MKTILAVSTALCAGFVMLLSSTAQGQNLFVSEYGGYIYKFTPSGARSTFASGLTRPTGLAFNSAGNLFEADFGSGNIYEFTTNGTRSTFASGLGGPLTLAFNSAGDLLVATLGGGNIYKFTPSGAQSTFASGLSSPSRLLNNGDILGEGVS